MMPSFFRTSFLAFLYLVSIASSTTVQQQPSPGKYDGTTGLMPTSPAPPKGLQKRLIGPMCIQDIYLLGVVKFSDCVEAHNDPGFYNDDDYTERSFGYSGLQRSRDDVVFPRIFKKGTCKIVLDMHDRSKDDQANWHLLRTATWQLIWWCSNQVQGFGPGGYLGELGDYGNIMIFLLPNTEPETPLPPKLPLKDFYYNDCVELEIPPDRRQTVCAASFGAPRTQPQCFMSDFYEKEGSNSPYGTTETSSKKIPYTWPLPAVGYCTSNKTCCLDYECVLSSLSQQVWAILFGVFKAVVEGAGSCLAQVGGSRLARRGELGIGRHPARRIGVEEDRRRCLCNLTLAHEECCRGGNMAVEQ